jgi:hypothetical protein
MKFPRTLATTGNLTLRLFIPLFAQGYLSRLTLLANQFDAEAGSFARFFGLHPYNR